MSSFIIYGVAAFGAGFAVCWFFKPQVQTAVVDVNKAVVDVKKAADTVKKKL